jgi:xanthine dehydrogenase YagS FAD-binding subunit
MNDFKWVQPKSINDAASALKDNGAALGGGIELLCLLKDDLLRPTRVVNLKSLPNLDKIDVGNTVRMGALSTLMNLAANAEIKRLYPVLSQAADSVGSPQIRNVGTVGGNLCQRPRCWYFRDPEVKCLKKGGTLCYAVGGANQYHAILGGGPCYIVHPSDLAPALIVLGATVVTNKRRIPIEDFFVPPTKRMDHETVVQIDEIVTGVEFPKQTVKSAYYKARERASFDWALASCAVALRMNGTTVEAAKIALGGVAPIPWRSEAAENALKGKTVTAESAAAAGKAALAAAQPLSENAYKIPLAENVVKIAIMAAAGLDPK